MLTLKCQTLPENYTIEMPWLLGDKSGCTEYPAMLISIYHTTREIFNATIILSSNHQYVT
jgi:hypothetical protein